MASLLDHGEILTRDSPKKLFENSFKIFKFGSNGTQRKFTVFVHFGAQFTFTYWGPNIFLKPKFLQKQHLSENQISPRSQKNDKVLIKLSKKKLGVQIGSKLPPWSCAKESSEILT